ncbi:1,3-beta-glucan synthase component, partial [Musa troglodytarum]
MASGSKHPPGRGGNGSADPKVRRTLSRKPTMLNVPQEEEATLLADSELVPILRVANEIETFSPRVAHLFLKTHYKRCETIRGKEYRARPWWAGSCCNLLTAIDYSQPEMTEHHLISLDLHHCHIGITSLSMVQLYLVVSGLERPILEDPLIQQNGKPLENALASQSIFQLGLLLVMEVGLEKGFQTAIGEFILMQLQLASVFFTFQLGTKAHYCGRPILRGRAKYRTTGHSFVLFHAKFADNYCMLSRSHFCLRTRAVDIVDRLLSIWKFTTKLNAVPVRH